MSFPLEPTPREIHVDPYGISRFDTYDPGTQIETTTALFRNNSCLSSVFDLAVRNRRQASTDRQFTVLSVACSYGPEVDGVLAYLTKEAPDIGRLSLLGIDINPVALTIAKQGKYLTTELDLDAYSCDNMDLLETLAAYSFRTYPFQDKSDVFVIDANGLRAQHDVSFLQTDLVESPPDLPPSDVVLCNNLLFHIADTQEGVAEKLVQVVSESLVEGGIISFGEGGLPVNFTLREDGIAQRKPAVEFILSLGLKSVLYESYQRFLGKDPLAIAFQKT